MTSDQIIAILGVVFTVLVWLFPPEPVRRFFHISNDSAGALSPPRRITTLVGIDGKNVQPPLADLGTKSDFKYFGPDVTEKQRKVRRVLIKCWLSACALILIAGIIL